MDNIWDGNPSKSVVNLAATGMKNGMIT